MTKNITLLAIDTKPSTFGKSILTVLIYDFFVIQIRHIWYEMMLAFIRDQTFMIWMTKSKYKLKFHMGRIPPHHGF